MPMPTPAPSMLPTERPCTAPPKPPAAHPALEPACPDAISASMLAKPPAGAADAKGVAAMSSAMEPPPSHEGSSKLPMPLPPPPKPGMEKPPEPGER